VTGVRTVHVVTHPESTHHVERLVGGWYDSELTPAGLAAAGSIGAALRARIPAGSAVVLCSSDLRRTLQTARAIGAALNVPVTTDPRLREKSYGEAEGRPQAWLDERFIAPPAVGDRLHHHEGVAGAETRWSLASRVYESLDRILESDAEHHVVVTHGFAATFVLAAWIGMPLESVGYVAFGVSSGSITELRQDDFFHNRSIAKLNDVAHLGGP
jgi:probable phosphoglycerate mutase